MHGRAVEQLENCPGAGLVSRKQESTKNSLANRTNLRKKEKIAASNAPEGLIPAGRCR